MFSIVAGVQYNIVVGVSGESSRMNQPNYTRLRKRFTFYYRNYSNLVRILITQNSAHFGKNGVSNLVREGKNF